MTGDEDDGSTSRWRQVVGGVHVCRAMDLRFAAPSPANQLELMLHCPGPVSALPTFDPDPKDLAPPSALTGPRRLNPAPLKPICSASGHTFIGVFDAGGEGQIRTHGAN
jgi:hypothetical protein